MDEDSKAILLIVILGIATLIGFIIGVINDNIDTFTTGHEIVRKNLNILDLCIKNPKIGQQVWYQDSLDKRGILVGVIRDIKIESEYKVESNAMMCSPDLLLTVDFEEIKDADNKHINYIKETRIIHQEEAFNCIENINTWLTSYVKRDNT